MNGTWDITYRGGLGLCLYFCMFRAIAIRRFLCDLYCSIVLLFYCSVLFTGAIGSLPWSSSVKPLIYQITISLHKPPIIILKSFYISISLYFYISISLHLYISTIRTSTDMTSGSHLSKV